MPAPFVPFRLTLAAILLIATSCAGDDPDRIGAEEANRTDRAVLAAGSPLSPRQWATVIAVGDEVLVVGGDSARPCPPGAHCDVAPIAHADTGSMASASPGRSGASVLACIDGTCLLGPRDDQRAVERSVPVPPETAQTTPPDLGRRLADVTPPTSGASSRGGR